MRTSHSVVVVAVLLVGCGSTSSNNTGNQAGDGGAGSSGADGESGESSAGAAASGRGGAGGSGGSGGTAGGGTTGMAGDGMDGGAGMDGGDAGMGGAGGAPPTETVVYDFYERACDGDWLAAVDSASSASAVVCNTNMTFGEVTRLAAAQADGNQTVESVMRVEPYPSANGVTSGDFAGISLIGAANPFFRTRLSCPANAASCEFRYQVVIREGGSLGPPDIVEQGVKTANGTILDIDIDLADYANASVDVVFVVTSNGTQNAADVGLWIGPRIVDVQ